MHVIEEDLTFHQNNGGNEWWAPLKGSETLISLKFRNPSKVYLLIPGLAPFLGISCSPQAFRFVKLPEIKNVFQLLPGG